MPAHKELTTNDGRESADFHDWVLIRELVARYNRAVDDGDGETFAGLFTDDGVLSVARASDEKRVVGRAALTDLASSRRPGDTVHITTDPMVAVDGDIATHLCTLLLLRSDSASGEVMVATGRYTDTIVRTSSGWRFSQRHVVLDAAHEARMSLAIAVQPSRVHARKEGHERVAED